MHQPRQVRLAGTKPRLFTRATPVRANSYVAPVTIRARDAIRLKRRGVREDRDKPQDFMMRRFLISFLLMLAMPPQAAFAAERWQILPPTPTPVPGLHSGHARVDGIDLYYAEIGRGSPVLVLHGGLGNSDYLGNQVRALAPHHHVIVVDSRGHGRSTRDKQPYGYDLMTDDVLALLDILKIPKADIVGWSDGAIIGLDMAIRHPDRVGRVFAFGVNTKTSGLKEGFDQNPVFSAFMTRARQDYARLSPTPTEYDAFQDQIGKMWTDQPNWTDAQLRSIKSPVLVVDGDHDEGIRREHTEYVAATIPGAGLLILPNVSHFAFLQDPVLFNAALLDFLGD
jgi:pimeloyl-ACP methyl ester carboxylesterase